ncbi:MAG TPA: acyl-CoA dehydrogenase family protein [Polyangiales bacterium]
MPSRRFVCRYRLGRKELIHYQEVQLAVAQMVTETSAMRALLWQSAREFTPTQAKASLTKLHCAERAVAVCDQAMDLLGNHGFLHGNYVEKAFRDARLTQIYEGTNQINRLAVIEDLQEQLLAQIGGGSQERS